MDLTAGYLQSVSQLMRSDGLTPGVLARAAVDLLPVDAAGISTLLGPLRLPLGASNDAAQLAEELQTSIGEGPCLTAAVARAACVIDLAEITNRWPVYGDELVRRTPFRSVASLPLSTPDGEVFAAMDLYAQDDHLSKRLELGGLDEQVGAPAAALLSICMAAVRTDDLEQALPDWYREVTARRHHVWVATGMLIGRKRQPTRDALSVLRAHAYALDRTLDDLADDLVEGRLTLDDIAP